jgi:hypothetical protein
VSENGTQIRLLRSTVILVVWLSVTATSAAGKESGIVGYSGQDGFSCNSCHSGGVAPDVRFEGPTAVATGQTALFRFIVTSHGSEQIAAGFDVSEEGTFANAVEVTHTQPRDNDENGEASWLFAWRAPDTLEEDTLYGAGNSVDGFVTQTGDGSATTTFNVQVGCAGDCSDDETVTVDELVRGIDIALGTEPLDDCRLADGNGDGSVSISELVAAVDSAVNGCP